MKQPNIIFVFDDQHRYEALGSAGNDIIKTPNFDRFAQTGMVFDRAYSNCPICSPFRGIVLTGRYPHKNGVMCNEYGLFDGQQTFPTVLKQAGYSTAFIGKWHLGHPPYTEDKRFGFDYMAAYNCEHNYYNVNIAENESEPVKTKDWAPISETDLALKFMESHVKDRKDKPFMMMLGWGPPHWGDARYDGYPDQFKTYSPDDIKLRPNVPEQMAEFAREEISHYYGLVTGLDHEMGRILDSVDKLGIAQDTIILFTSDHGDHLWSHGYGKPGDNWLHHSKRASKATPYEESIHIPCLVKWPGVIPAGSRCDSLFSAADMMPSLLALSKNDIPETVQGADLSLLFKGEGGQDADSVYLQILGTGWPTRPEWVGFWRGIRTKQHIYARWHNGKEKVLFDCEKDPYEMNNLAGHSEAADIEAELEARLQKWLKETDDPFETGEREPVYSMLDLGQKFTSSSWDDVQW